MKKQNDCYLHSFFKKIKSNCAENVSSHEEFRRHVCRNAVELIRRVRGEWLREWVSKRRGGRWGAGELGRAVVVAGSESSRSLFIPPASGPLIRRLQTPLMPRPPQCRTSRCHFNGLICCAAVSVNNAAAVRGAPECIIQRRLSGLAPFAYEVLPQNTGGNGDKKKKKQVYRTLCSKWNK